MQYTIFSTPGKIDMSVIDVMGATIKPNTDNPIGFFGTGLKLGIASLIRLGCTIELYTQGNHYRFYTSPKTIRGKTFQMVKYRRTNWSLDLKRYATLPYTTELGKTWEMWQGFREFYANTLDEGGEVYCIGNDDLDILREEMRKSLNYSHFVIGGKDFADIAENRDKIFLPAIDVEDRDTLYSSSELEIIDQRSDHIYYRRMRALDLPEDKPAMLTYNILEKMELTEDRTLKSLYSVRSLIVGAVSRSTDKNLIRKVLLCAPKSFEADLDFSYVFGASDEFVEMLRVLKDKPINRTASYYYNTYVDVPKDPKVSDNVWSMVEQALKEAKEAMYMDNRFNHLDVVGVDDIYKSTFKRVMDRQ